MWRFIKRAFKALAVVGVVGSAMVNVFIPTVTPWRAVLICFGLYYICWLAWNDSWSLGHLHRVLRRGKWFALVQLISYLIPIWPILSLFVNSGVDYFTMDITDKCLLTAAIFFMAVGAVFAAVFFSRLGTRKDVGLEPSNQTATKSDISDISVRKAKDKKDGAMTDQKSYGENSPNIIGNNVNVTMNIGQPQQPMTEDARWSIRQIPSPEPTIPYASEITIQFQSEISRYAAFLRFQNPIVKGIAHSSAQFMDGFGDVDMTKVQDPSRAYIVNLVQTTPPLGPRNPLIVVILANEPIRIVSAERLLH